MDLGSRIKEARERQNLSQDELAEKMNISRQAISKWETGKSYPDIEKILKLSDIFNLSLDELVKGDKTFQENLIMESRDNNFRVCTCCAGCNYKHLGRNAISV